MRGGMRDRDGPGPGGSACGAGPAACPWGCAPGPGGWNGAPFCPWHRLSGLGELPVLPRGPSQTVIQCEEGEVCLLWDDGPRLEHFYQLEDDDEDESDTDYEERDEFWDVPLVERPRPYSYCGFRKSFLCAEPPPQPPRAPPSALEARLDRLPTPRRARLTAEEAERNAQELVAEEERVKKKAEKKKLKKKKQKDRKKREKLCQEQKNKENTDPSPPAPSSPAGTGPPRDGAEEEGGCTGPSPHPGSSTAPSEDTEGAEEELDLSCTFVCKAREKAGVRLRPPGKERPPGTGDTELGRRAPEKGRGESPAPPQPPGPGAVEQSLMLAGHGIAAAQAGQHDEAVRAFSAALELNPQEHRLLGNRSYCLEKLGRYEEALRDAEAALGLQPGWPKGSFRKGKALRGLQRYAEAAHTFEQLLLRDGANAEAAAQLEACRALLRRSRSGAVPVSPFLPETKEPPLLPGGWVSGSSQHTGDTSVAGGSTGTPARGPGQGPATATSHPTLPPSHPARDCFPLWVGNVTSRISEKVLRHTFGRFGEIRSVRMLPGRRCAFINFCGKAAAEAAFGAMQVSWGGMRGPPPWGCPGTPLPAGPVPVRAPPVPRVPPWRAASWCCSSSTRPTPRRPPRPAPGRASLPGGCSDDPALSGGAAGAPLHLPVPACTCLCLVPLLGVGVSPAPALGGSGPPCIPSCLGRLGPG
ncbi:tetratricopeptide repeat protein 31 isoform X2 [Myiozetetes cayanensis]|uniref:tetratricopeptide repeat protein 31 isoform X2 n=1 Tax=Myiozetetes cayanensis TaxID=478635 RepID=UPI0021602291|nr:tetratricopeptide repeat protein 31 isoform X2 [Myiozetetes cayanensis]